MEKPNPEPRIRVEAPPGNLIPRPEENSEGFPWLFGVLLLLAVGCAAASLYLAYLSSVQ